ncbi:MAG: hypothetical protein RMK90_08695, partial [Acetobacteraceae bacterium]|nr:hypothetical protein [Acetobacteraceae bacterium]
MATLPLAAPAGAQPVEGLYVGAGAGLNWLQRETYSGTGGLSSEFDIGWGVVISLGWGFGNGVRAEVEGSYRQNDARGSFIVGDIAAIRVPVRGHAASYGIMGNAFYDFHGLLAGIVPY